MNTSKLTASVKVEMIKTPINDSVTTTVTATLTATPIENANATGGSSVSKVAGDPESFATDSWSTIQRAVQNNNTSVYNVGDTKSVTINGVDYRVRIANKTTGEHCGDNDTEYSQTACGFVVEFADIVEQRAMNSTSTNVGGWPSTEMRTYLNGTFYNSLPSDLQAVIKPTRVISGHGSNDSTNFTTTDKLYLLSSEEVYGIGRNLDKTVKQYNSSNTWWWLRSANSNGSSSFRDVDYGDLNNNDASKTYGVAPAFRIG